MDAALRMAHAKGPPPFDMTVGAKHKKHDMKPPTNDHVTVTPRKVHRQDPKLWVSPYGPPQPVPGINGKSIFHVPMPPLPLRDCQDALVAVGKFAESVQEMCRAGTCTADRLSSVLAPTVCGDIAGQLSHVQRHLEEDMADVTAWVKAEIDAYIKQLALEDGNDGKGKGQTHNSQMLGMGLMLLVQLQQQFFLNAAEQLSIFGQRYAHLGANGLIGDNKHRPPHASSQSRMDPKLAGMQSDGRKTSQGLGSPGRIRKQLAMLFSRRKAHMANGGMVEPSQTAWYVNLDKENRQPVTMATREAQGPSAGQMSAGHEQNSNTKKAAAFNVADNDSQTAPKPKPATSVQSTSSSNGVTGSAPSNQTNAVSEEELDVVIDMLSRSNKYSPAEEKESPDVSNVVVPPVPPPGQVPTLGPLSKAPGSQLSTSNVQPVFSNSAINMGSNGFYSNRAAQHRQSDGFIMDSNVSREAKTNTWPSRPRHRDNHSTPWLEPDFLQPQQGYFPPGPPHSAPGAPGYEADSSPSVKQSPANQQNPVLAGFNPGPWSIAPEDANSRGWPTFPKFGDSEAVPRQWAVPDSSSCSDESSSNISNGDLQWMLAMNLVEPNMKRRHSSGGEDSALNPGVVPNNSINKSIDSLMEPKSTNTWPPKQLWGARVPGDEEGRVGMPDPGVVGATKTAHRPLVPQWSDPLAARPLAVWDSGLPNSLSQQNFCTLPLGGLPTEYSPAARMMAPPGDKPF